MNDDHPARAIELIEVHKVYEAGAVRALDGLDFSVEEGERVAVMGPSGCGKSTMLHLIAALERPTSGRVRVCGHDLSSIRDLAAYRRSTIGLVFQLHNLLPQLSAVHNVEIALFGSGLSRRDRHRRARQLLDDVGLGDQGDRPPTKLSGGERQRVAIARALANEPRLILADEPTGSLDEDSIELVLDLFAKLANERPMLTMVLVTHDARVAATAHRIVHLRHGRLDPNAAGVTETLRVMPPISGS